MKTIENHRKALIIVDVQSSFLNKENDYVVNNIINHLSKAKYDLYIVATFSAEPGSIWEIQQDWTCLNSSQNKTVYELRQILDTLNVLQVSKHTKSVFKGNVDLLPSLHRNQIKEIHIAGLETDDCVLATAYEAFDWGFITYVIEECCQSTSMELHLKALDILRGQNMTSQSSIRKSSLAEVLVSIT
jgi:nicotinamidase-related amidase